MTDLLRDSRVVSTADDIDMPDLPSGGSECGQAAGAPAVVALQRALADDG